MPGIFEDATSQRMIVNRIVIKEILADFDIFTIMLQTQTHYDDLENEEKVPYSK